MWSGFLLAGCRWSFGTQSTGTEPIPSRFVFPVFCASFEGVAPMTVSYYDLDAALVALEALGYEWHPTQRHLYLSRDGATAQLVQCLGGEVEVIYQVPPKASKITARIRSKSLK